MFISFLVSNAALVGMLSMCILTIWYWLIAYKYDVVSIHPVPGLFFGVLFPSIFLGGAIVFAVIAAHSNNQIVSYLPLVAGAFAVAALGAATGSVLAGPISEVVKDKAKLFYVAGAYQLLMLMHLCTKY